MAECATRTRVWRNGVLEAEDFPFEQVSDYLAQPDCLVWADLCAPDHTHLAQLAEELQLDAHAVEDAVSHRERPKATRYATHLFLTTAAVKFDTETGELTTTQISSFGLERGIVTVRSGPEFDVEDVVRNWDENSDLMKYGFRALIWGLLDVIVDGYFTAVEALDDAIEGIEDILFGENAGAEGRVQRRSFALRKALVHARRTILPMREVVNTIARHATQEQHHSELGPYYDDLYDHVIRSGEWTESLRDLITSVFETNLSLADARLNTIMKKLTSWAAIIAVPTAVTGFFGQNVPYPGFGKQSGFVYSTLITAALAGFLYLLFKRKGWL